MKIGGSQQCEPPIRSCGLRHVGATCTGKAFAGQAVGSSDTIWTAPSSGSATQAARKRPMKLCGGLSDFTPAAINSSYAASTSSVQSAISARLGPGSIFNVPASRALPGYPRIPNNQPAERHLDVNRVTGLRGAKCLFESEQLGVEPNRSLDIHDIGVTCGSRNMECNAVPPQPRQQRHALPVAVKFMTIGQRFERGNPCGLGSRKLLTNDCV